MKKVLLGDYGLTNGGNPVFNAGDKVYARTTAVKSCDGVNDLLSPAAYDNTPVILRAGATRIDAPTCAMSENDSEIEVCWD